MYITCLWLHSGMLSSSVVSFVRSVTMDKWKDLELEKMKVGGNKKAREFLQSQSDWDETKSFQERYNSKAAALLRDKVSIYSIVSQLLSCPIITQGNANTTSIPSDSLCYYTNSRSLYIFSRGNTSEIYL